MFRRTLQVSALALVLALLTTVPVTPHASAEPASDGAPSADPPIQRVDDPSLSVDEQGQHGRAGPSVKATRTTSAPHLRTTVTCPIDARSYTADGIPVDDGAVDSLRWAVELANLTPSCNEINVHPGVHVLTIGEQLDVTAGLRVTGISSALGTRPLIKNVAPNRTLRAQADLDITGLDMSGGLSGQAGAIVALVCACSFTATDTSFADGYSAWGGGGLAFWPGSTAVLDRVVVRDNRTDNNGAGVFADGNLEIVDSLFTGNELAFAGQWTSKSSALFQSSQGSGTTVIRRSQFDSNAGGFGAAVYIRGDRDVTIVETEFTNNSGSSNGSHGWGTLTLDSGADLRISDSLFTGNIGMSEITAQSIDAERLFIDDPESTATIVIGADAGPARIANSTIIDRAPKLPFYPSATIVTAGLPPAELTLEHTTVLTAQRSVFETGLGPVEVRFSYLQADAELVCASGANVVAHAWNYATDSSCNGVPFVGPPAEFEAPTTAGGGFGPSLAPPADSPLIDAIPIAECSSPEDQRRRFRPNGDGCDIGAVEWYFSEGPIGIGGPG